MIPDERIATAGIFASGRLIFNPEWLQELPLAERSFVLAHEMMHLALKTHYRADTKDAKLFNITHDFIINEYLKEGYGFDSVPANGLDWGQEYEGYYSITDKPAEELMQFIKDALGKNLDESILLRLHWSKDIRLIFGRSGSLLLENDGRMDHDVLSNELEQELFPGISLKELSAKRSGISERVFKSENVKLIMDRTREAFGKGTEPGCVSATYDMIKTRFKQPWESALQNWMDFTTRTGHTYTRPSRRGQNPDYVMPGYKREGYTIHIVIDTSGSMDGILGKILGAIAAFCDELMIENIHIVQCDTGVSDDSWYSPDQLVKFEIKGFGGSNLSDGMFRLQKDPEVQSAIVITDGYIDYPRDAMSYDVLWVLTCHNSGFIPGYGKIIEIDH